MYCQKCGNNIENGAKFCARCGTAVNNNPAVARPVVNNPQTNTPQPIKKDEQKNKKVPIIIAAVTLLLVIVGVVLFFVLSDGSDKNTAAKADSEEKTTVAQTEDALADEYNDTTVGEIEVTTEPVTMPSLPTTDYEYIKEKGTLEIGITDYVPMNYYDEYGNLVGFDTEFAEAVCAELGVEPVFELINWEEKVDLLNRKEIDCIWNGMTITEEMKATASVSIPYMKCGLVLIVRAEDSDKYTSAGSLNGAAVAYERNSWAESLVMENEFFSGAVYFDAESTYKAIQSVYNGTADACVADYAYKKILLDETNTDFSGLVAVDSLIFNEEDYGIAFRQGSGDITVRVNEIINKLYESGKLYEIAEKYGLEDTLLIGGRNNFETVTEGKLTVATNAWFAPFEYFDENGECAGIDIEIAQYIANELGLELEIVDMDFDSITHSVSQGKADLGIAAITPTEEKLEYVDFTDSYYTYNVSILSMEDVYSIEGKTVGSLYGSSAYFYVEYELADKYVNHKTYNDISLLKKDFEAGYLDYVVIPFSYEESFISGNENVHGYWVQDYDNYAICYSKENEQLQKEIDAVLSQMIADGTLDEIFKKYMLNSLTTP